MSIPNLKLVEAIGKLSIATLAVCGLIWVLHEAITQNKEMTAALTKQVELVGRQTVALEKLVEVYSGKPTPKPGGV